MKSKIRKLIFSLGLGITSLGVMTTTFTSFSTQVPSTANTIDKQNAQTNTRDNATNMEATFGDIVTNMNNGWITETVRKIVVASPQAADDTQPDLSKKLLEIAIQGNQITVTNTFGTHEELWNSIGGNNPRNIFDAVDPEKPWVDINQNYFKLTTFDGTAGIGGTSAIKWDKDNPEPSGINGTINLDDNTSSIMQLVIKNTRSTNFSIFADRNEVGNAAWEKIDGNRAMGSGVSGSLVAMEVVIQKNLDNGKTSLYIPNASGNTNTGTFSQDTDSPEAVRFKSMPSNVAFKSIQKEKFKLKKLIKYNPSLALNSMRPFKVNVELQADENRWVITYGETPEDKNNINKHFKYGLYAQQTTMNISHIYPYHFDTTNLPGGAMQAGKYINLAPTFNNTNKDYNIITGFSNGTYYDDGDYNIDKNQYPTNVPISELKRLILARIRNAPSGFNESNIILDDTNRLSELTRDNANGEIRFKVVINKYKNNDGDVINASNGHLISDVQVITGFKKIRPTEVVKNRYSITDHSIPSSSYKEAQIRQLVLDNKNTFFSNLAEELDPANRLTLNDIRVSNIRTFNRPEGQYQYARIECTVELTGGFLTKPNALPAKPGDRPLSFNLIIDGFKVVTTTIFHNDIRLSGFESILADQYYSSNASFMRLYEDNKNLFVENLPNPNVNPTIIDGSLRGSNLGIDTIDNGNSGYITVRLRFPKIFDDNGNEQTNSVQAFQIYGFRKIIPTEINKEVTVNRKNDLATELIKGSQQEKNAALKELINRNQTSFFGRTSLPDNYIDQLDVDVQEVNNLEGFQIKATLTLKTFFGKDGLLKAPNSPTQYLQVPVKIGGFKEVKPTSLDGGTVNVIDSNRDKYAFQAADEKNGYSNLKKIIMNKANSLSKNIIKGDLPDSFNENDIIIAQGPVNGIPNSDAPIINNRRGQVSFSIYLRTWYGANGELMTAQGQDYTPGAPYANITIIGFKEATPTTINIKPTLIIPQEHPSYKNLTSTNVADLVVYLQKDFNSLTNKERVVVVEFKQFLYENVFEGFKLPFNPETSIVVEPFDSGKFFIDPLDGSLINIKVSLYGYMDEKGTIIDDQYLTTTTKKTVKGFKRIVPTTVSTKYERTSTPFQVPAIWADSTPNQIIQNKDLGAVIRDHDRDNALDPQDRIILGDIPPNFIYEIEENNDVTTGSLIINKNEIKIDNEASTITFPLKLNRFYMPNSGQINSPGFTTAGAIIQIAGFKSIPSTTINKTVITDKFIYPTKSNSFRKTLDVNIQEYSDAKYKTSDLFIQSIMPPTNDTDEITNTILDKTIYYSESINEQAVVSQPIIIYNPEKNNKMEVKAILVDTINNDTGSIILTAIVTGYYFSSSTQPTKIENNNGESFACIDINLKGFISNIAYQTNHDQAVVMVPVLIASVVLVIFLCAVLSRLGVKKYRNRIKREKDLFFED